MDERGAPTLSSWELWRLLLVQSALLAGLGAGLAWWWSIPIALDLPDLRQTLLALLLVLPLLLSSLVLVRFSSRYVRAIELLQRILAPPLKRSHIPLLALVSAGVEEFFFRGVLQPLLGLWAAAALFGMAHVWNRLLVVHGAWAAVAGVYLGLEYQMTGNLVLPVLTHAVNNLVGLSLLKRNHRPEHPAR